MKYITVSPELEMVCRAKMEETLEIYRQKRGVTVPLPILKFSQMGRRAGICRLQYVGFFHSLVQATATVVINPDYFKNYYDDMLNDTVPHEVAHYIAVYVHGYEASGHGHYWKRVMADIGIPSADRCHQYSLEGVKTRNTQTPYKYTCKCSGEGRLHMFTPTKHKKHQYSLSVGCRGYRCRGCRTSLVYEGFTHNGNFIPAKERPVATFITTATPLNEGLKYPIMVTPKETTSGFRSVTKFMNGSLVNVRVPLAA